MLAQQRHENFILSLCVDLVAAVVTVWITNPFLSGVRII